MTEPLHRLGIADLAAGYAARAFTVAEVLEYMIARAATLGPKLRAFIEVDEAGAHQAAAASDSRITAAAAGPLEGIPVAVKANIDVSGLETSAGIEARRGMIAGVDSEAVSRLRAAGAVILGTLNMHEAALGADNDNPWFGRALNPHSEDRTPGGSSGGSAAAVAAGLCVVALGTDTLGSIRIPAAYCGIYGLKPTAGAVSQEGLELVAAGFDTIGPLARSLDDLEAMFRVLAKADEPQSIRRIALLRDLGGVRCEPAVLAGYNRALQALRTEGVEKSEAIDVSLEPIRIAGFVAASRELGARLHHLRRDKPEGFSKTLHFLLDYGAGRDHDQLRDDAETLAVAKAAVRDAVGAGALLLPTAPQAAFVHGGRAPVNQADFTALASIAGLPALSIPAGMDEAGLPVAVQLVGAAGNELALIDLARRLEKHLGGFVAPPGF